MTSQQSPTQTSVSFPAAGFGWQRFIRLFIGCIGLRFIKLALSIDEHDVESEGEADRSSQSHHGWERWRWQVSPHFTIHVR